MEVQRSQAGGTTTRVPGWRLTPVTLGAGPGRGSISIVRGPEGRRVVSLPEVADDGVTGRGLSGMTRPPTGP